MSHTNIRNSLSTEDAKWKEAIENKIQSMYDNQLLNLVNPATSTRAVGCKWVLKNINWHEFECTDIQISTSYERLYSDSRNLLWWNFLSSGSKQIYSDTTCHNHLLGQWSTENWCKNHFPYGKLTEDVYMTPPEGLV